MTLPCLPSQSGPPEQRTRDEELIERKLTLEDLALGQPMIALEVEGRDDLTGHDRPRESGRELLDRTGSHVGKAVAFDIPRGVSQRVRRKLHVGGHYVMGVRRERRVEERRNIQLDPRLLRAAAVFRSIERPFEGVDSAAQPDAA